MEYTYCKDGPLVTLEPIQPFEAYSSASSSFRFDLRRLYGCISASDVLSSNILHRTVTTLPFGEAVFDSFCIPFGVIIQLRIKGWICVAINHEFLRMMSTSLLLFKGEAYLNLAVGSSQTGACNNNECMHDMLVVKEKECINEGRLYQQEFEQK